MQKTIQALKDHQFSNIRMIETLSKSLFINEIPAWKSIDAKTGYPKSSKRPLVEDDGEEQKPEEQSAKEEKNGFLCSVSPRTVRGHTSYLVFATFLPLN